jgi:hypothetical protein
MKLRHCSACFFASLFTLFASPSQAAWYQVEIIVFEYLEPDSNGESWYENPGLPDRTNSIELIAELADGEDEEIEVPSSGQGKQNIPQNKAELIPYLQLHEDKFRLEGIQRVLKLSREYRPLMHVSWQQPSLTPTSARAVHIQKHKEPETIVINDLETGESNSLDDSFSDQNGIEDVYQVLDLIFDGTIRLRSSRFLHVDVDIAFFPEFLTEAENIQEQGLFVQQQADYVRLQESRKIKLNEIHYFDHPTFGVVLRASRLNLN